jgi:hypothetical protein
MTSKLRQREPAREPELFSALSELIEATTGFIARPWIGKERDFCIACVGRAMEIRDNWPSANDDKASSPPLERDERAEARELLADALKALRLLHPKMNADWPHVVFKTYARIKAFLASLPIEGEKGE